RMTSSAALCAALVIILSECAGQVSSVRRTRKSFLMTLCSIASATPSPNQNLSFDLEHHFAALILADQLELDDAGVAALRAVALAGPGRSGEQLTPRDPGGGVTAVVVSQLGQRILGGLFAGQPGPQREHDAAVHPAPSAVIDVGLALDQGLIEVKL